MLLPERIGGNPVGDSLKLNVDASLEPNSNFVRVGSICNLVRIHGTRRR